MYSEVIKVAVDQISVKHKPNLIVDIWSDESLKKDVNTLLIPFIGSATEFHEMMRQETL